MSEALEMISLSSEVLTPGQKLAIREQSKVFGISSIHFEQLYHIFLHEIALHPERNNLDTMLLALKNLRAADSTFFFSLQVTKVTRLVQACKNAGLIQPKKYPKTRVKVQSAGRVSLTEEKVFAIISSNPEIFRESIRKERGLEWWYRAFWAEYNEHHPTEYFPPRWKSLGESVKTSIKSLLWFGQGNIRVLDAEGLRFSTREEIITHPYFREFLVYFLLRAKKSGIVNFRIALTQALSFWWHHLASPTWLRVPVVACGRKNTRSTFQEHIGAPTASMRDILGALWIDERVWTAQKPVYKPSPKIDLLLRSNPFTTWITHKR